MRTPGTRDCGGCRYWSEMIAMSHGNGVVAMCLSKGKFAGKYTRQTQTCPAFAKNRYGAVDDPPNYGEETRKLYAEEAAKKHDNGQPMHAPDGTMLDDKGNRSIFDDVDE